MRKPVSFAVALTLAVSATLAFIAFANTTPEAQQPSRAYAYAVPRILQDTRAILTADLSQSNLSMNVQRNHFQPNRMQLLTKQGTLITYELTGGTLTRSSRIGTTTLGTNISSFTPTVKGRTIEFTFTFTDSTPYSFVILTPEENSP